MKYSIIFLILLIISSYAVLGENVDVTFIPPAIGPIVKGVPFDLNVMMDSNGNDVMRIQLYTTVTVGEATFNSLSRNGEIWLPRNTLKDNQKLPTGNWWFNLVTTVGDLSGGIQGILSDKTEIGSAKKVFSLSTTIHDQATISLTDSDNVAYNPDVRLEVVSQPIDIIAIDSTCGDGVVGYIDENTNGIKDKDLEGTPDEVNEACDDGNTDNEDGCSVDCRYIDMGYKLEKNSNCAFSSRTCQLVKMDAKELLKAKLNALIDGQCYPNCEQPDAYNKNGNVPKITYTEVEVDRVSKKVLEPQKKIQFIIMVGEALKEFFTSV